MQLKYSAAMAALVVAASMGQAQRLYSFENDLNGFTIGAAAGTLTRDTQFATHGSYSMRLDRVAGSGWNQMTTNIDATIRQMLIDAPKRIILVDVTQTDAGAYWRQMYPIFNSPSGGWSQGAVVGLNYAQNGTVTYAIPYDGTNIPGIADPWGQQVFIYQCEGAAPVAPIWFDNFRIEDSALGESFEDGVGNVQQQLNAGETADVTFFSGTQGNTEGSSSLGITWNGGFRWIKIGLDAQAVSAFNASNGTLLFDVFLPTRFDPGGWGNMRIGLNDNSGWRELPDQFDLPGWAGGRKTMAFDLSSLGDFAAGSPWNELLIAINGPAGAAKTFYIDNIRFERSEGAAAISGRIDIDGLAIDEGAVVKLQVRQPGTLNLAVPEIDVTLGADGDYSVPMGSLPAGSYDLWFKAKNTISAMIANVAIGATGVAGQDAALKSGDIDGDNSVTVFDYDKLSAYFDKSDADGDWNTSDGDGVAPADADLDGDGSITVFDYDLLSTNFDQTGPE